MPRPCSVGSQYQERHCWLWGVKDQWSSDKETGKEGAICQPLTMPYCLRMFRAPTELIGHLKTHNYSNPLYTAFYLFLTMNPSLLTGEKIWSSLKTEGNHYYHYYVPKCLPLKPRQKKMMPFLVSAQWWTLLKVKFAQSWWMKKGLNMLTFSSGRFLQSWILYMHNAQRFKGPQTGPVECNSRMRKKK